MEKYRTYTKFPGFRRNYGRKYDREGGFFMYPTILEQYWHQMSGSQQKCLDYILRKTIGWFKSMDRISWSQFENGMDGTKNRGTGLSKSQIKRAVRKLELMGFIRVHRERSRPNYIELVLDDDDYMDIIPGMLDAFKNDKRL